MRRSVKEREKKESDIDINKEKKRKENFPKSIFPRTRRGSAIVRGLPPPLPPLPPSLATHAVDPEHLGSQTLPICMSGRFANSYLLLCSLLAMSLMCYRYASSQFFVLSSSVFFFLLFLPFLRFFLSSSFLFRLSYFLLRFPSLFHLFVISPSSFSSLTLLCSLFFFLFPFPFSFFVTPFRHLCISLFTHFFSSFVLFFSIFLLFLLRCFVSTFINFFSSFFVVSSQFLNSFPFRPVPLLFLLLSTCIDL